MQTKIYLLFIKVISAPKTKSRPLGDAPLSIFLVCRAAMCSVLDRKIHQVMDYSSHVFLRVVKCSECQGMIYAKRNANRR